MTKSMCPVCQKPVEVKYFPARGFEDKPYYYEPVPVTKIETRVSNRLGIPIRHLNQHKCQCFFCNSMNDVKLFCGVLACPDCRRDIARGFGD